MNPQQLNILYEDTHILVCDKPAGIATQSRSINHPDLVSILKNHIARHSSEPKTIKEPYLAVIHRLDQPVRGIMVFAKTPYAARELNQELTEYHFEKHYRALVLGVPAQPEAVLENYLVKDTKANFSRICKKDAPGAKYAKLSYKVVTDAPRLFTESQYDNNTLLTELDIQLYTGRHHQIRIQLAGIGCPIAGDTKYNSNTQPSKEWKNLCLCSYLLKFTHPKTKKRMCFSLLQEPARTPEL